MKNKIPLNKNTFFDRMKLLQSRMVILANSGGGKSYAIRKFAEEANGDTQTIIIDPEGEFASLREKYDFILAGKNADVPAEVRSAGLLATRLLELGKSAVIDLYELHPQDRQRFVKLFFDAMINAPKELYHPVFIILDEAHEYAPEGKPSEATWAVEAMASKGRKRGFCLIPASQRISKLSKNVSAECNNKLIGRASQDIDMKRAGDELGFNKDRMKELRQLVPGEFFAFGPAISDDIQKIKIGEVKTTHAKVGYHGSGKVPPPSSVIKKVLAEIKDLPQEAAEEAKTSADLKAQLAAARREITDLKKKPPVVLVDADPKEIQKKIDVALKEQAKIFDSEKKDLIAQIKRIFGTFQKIRDMASGWDFDSILEEKEKPHIMNVYKGNYSHIPKVMPTKKPGIFTAVDEVRKDQLVQIDLPGSLTSMDVSSSEQKILDAIAWCESININEPGNDLVAFLSGYSHPRSSGYRNPRGSLNTKGFIVTEGGKIKLTSEGRDRALVPLTPLTQQELHRIVLEKLDGPERKLLAPLLEAYPEAMSNTELSSIAGYTHERSSGYRNPRGRLSSFGLIEISNGQLKAKPFLFI